MLVRTLETEIRPHSHEIPVFHLPRDARDTRDASLSVPAWPAISLMSTLCPAVPSPKTAHMKELRDLHSASKLCFSLVPSRSRSLANNVSPAATPRPRVASWPKAAPRQRTDSVRKLPRGRQWHRGVPRDKRASNAVFQTPPQIESLSI